MNISKLNPIHFFLLGVPIAYDNVTPAPIDLSLATFAVTFNREDRREYVRDFKPYYHKIVPGNDTLIDVLADDATDTFKVLIFDTSGVKLAQVDMAQVGATSHVTATLGGTELTAYIGQRVVFAIFNDTDDVILAVTDAIDIVSSVYQSTKILYQNPNVDYADANKDSVFNLQLRAAFAIPDYPEEIQNDTYSNGTAVLLTSEVKERRLLKVLPVPGYVHQKIKIALKCGSITIAGLSWVQETAYEKGEIQEDFEFTWGSVWLTLQGSTIRNVYTI